MAYKNAEDRRAWWQRWKKANPEAYKKRVETNNTNRRKKYWPTIREGLWRKKGIDMTYPVYLKMRDACGNRCEICNLHNDTIDKELVVDHNHANGKVRGLLCTRCNRALGLFKDSRPILLRAARYLKRGRE